MKLREAYTRRADVKPTAVKCYVLTNKYNGYKTRTRVFGSALEAHETMVKEAEAERCVLKYFKVDAIMIVGDDKAQVYTPHQSVIFEWEIEQTVLY